MNFLPFEDNFPLRIGRISTRNEKFPPIEGVFHAFITQYIWLLYQKCVTLQRFYENTVNAEQTDLKN